MSSLKAAYINELYKISKKKKIFVAAILSVGALLLASLIVSTVDNFMGIRLTGNSEFSIMVLNVMNYTLIPLFTAFICIDMFGGEFSSHTIKMTLTSPVSRFKVFTAKALAAATFIVAHLFFVMLVSYVISLFISGTSLNFFRVLIAYLASFFPLMVFALMVIVVSNLTKGTTSAFMLSVLLYLVLIAMQFVFANVQSFFYTSAFSWYTLFLGGFFNYQKVIRTFLILAGYGLMFYAIGYYLFEKREI